MSISWQAFERMTAVWVHDESVVQRLNREQRLLFGINMLRQEVASGGFDRYFEYGGSETAADAVEGAKLLGPQWHSLVQLAVQTKRLDLDEQLYALENDHPADDVLDEFVRTHWASFEQLC